MSKTSSVRRLVDCVAGDPTLGPVEAFLTTTFDLEPDFFERDFLPALLRLPALDDFSYRGCMQREIELAKLSAAVVLMEARRYQGRPRSLRLHVQPARRASSGVLHAKVTLAVHANAVRLVVGSANLTTNGYRHNREVVVALSANPKSPEESALLLEALEPLPTLLSRWWGDDAQRALALAQDRLRSWVGKPSPKVKAERDAAFLWGGGPEPLWQQFARHWPQGERIRRIRIVSPFWSEATSDGPLPRLLSALRAREAQLDKATVTLICAASPDTASTWQPALPISYGTFDFRTLGVSVEAIAARPTVDKEEGGSEEVPVERRLHAKVLVIDGVRTSLAYLGSANFSLPGWGFIPAAESNIEAGLAMWRASGSDPFKDLIPPTHGTAVPLIGDGHARIRPAAETEDDAPPWPAFLHGAELRRHATTEALVLALRLGAGAAAPGWSVALDEQATPLHTSTGSQTATLELPLQSDDLTILLRNQTVHVRWAAYPVGTSYPLNVPMQVRERLPLGDPNVRPTENDLIAFFQGRIALEDVYGVEEEGEGRGANEEVGALASNVDTGKILAYQVRGFVEALPGIRDELHRSAVSEPSIRFAALGPVSPVALAREIARAAEAGRSSVAAGFQLTEIVLCLDTALALDVPIPLQQAWNNVLCEARQLVLVLLTQLRQRDVALGADSRFEDYRSAFLGPVTSVEVGS
ncbi:MAG: hypothetical protein Q8S73_11075 [Deltaproteobacteria bacterium]|nr:hypothetical protein [Myxococcales bacterium]MDP3214638.1 hypothetical protein [Deltaproteobacteria bacterium]